MSGLGFCSGRRLSSISVNFLNHVGPFLHMEHRMLSTRIGEYTAKEKPQKQHTNDVNPKILHEI